MKKSSNFIFFTYALVTATVGFDWFMWGPIIHSEAFSAYKASPFFLTVFLSAIPLMLVLFSYFAGNLADRDPKRSTTIAAVILGTTSLLKPLVSFNFYSLLILHLVFALSAVFCFTSWSPITYRLFEKERAAHKVANFTAALVIGEFLGYIITYPITSKMGLVTTLTIYGTISAAISFLYIISIARYEFPYSVQPKPRPGIISGFKLILREKAIISLFIIAFLDIGVFVWISSWYPKLFTQFKGLSAEQASLVPSLKLVGCLIGALTIPSITHKIHKVRPFFIFLPLLSALMFFLVPFINSNLLLLADSLILGFTMFPVYPIGVHLPSAYSRIGVEYAGIGSGIILIFANLGGFLLPQLGSFAANSLWQALIVFGVIPMLLISIVAIFFRDPDSYIRARQS